MFCSPETSKENGGHVSDVKKQTDPLVKRARDERGSADRDLNHKLKSKSDPLVRPEKNCRKTGRLSERSRSRSRDPDRKTRRHSYRSRSRSRDPDRKTTRHSYRSRSRCYRSRSRSRDADRKIRRHSYRSRSRSRDPDRKTRCHSYKSRSRSRDADRKKRPHSYRSRSRSRDPDRKTRRHSYRSRSRSYRSRSRSRDADRKIRRHSYRSRSRSRDPDRKTRCHSYRSRSRSYRSRSRSRDADRKKRPHSYRSRSRSRDPDRKTRRHSYRSRSRSRDPDRKTRRHSYRSRSRSYRSRSRSRDADRKKRPHSYRSRSRSRDPDRKTRRHSYRSRSRSYRSRSRSRDADRKIRRHSYRSRSRSRESYRKSERYSKRSRDGSRDRHSKSHSRSPRGRYRYSESSSGSESDSNTRRDKNDEIVCAFEKIFEKEFGPVAPKPPEPDVQTENVHSIEESEKLPPPVLEFPAQQNIQPQSTMDPFGQIPVSNLLAMMSSSMSTVLHQNLQLNVNQMIPQHMPAALQYNIQYPMQVPPQEHHGISQIVHFPIQANSPPREYSYHDQCQQSEMNMTTRFRMRTNMKHRETKLHRNANAHEKEYIKKKYAHEKEYIKKKYAHEKEYIKKKFENLESSPWEKHIFMAATYYHYDYKGRQYTLPKSIFAQRAEASAKIANQMARNPVINDFSHKRNLKPCLRAAVRARIETLIHGSKKPSYTDKVVQYYRLFHLVSTDNSFAQSVINTYKRSENVENFLPTEDEVAPCEESDTNDEIDCLKDNLQEIVMSNMKEQTFTLKEISLKEDLEFCMEVGVRERIDDLFKNWKDLSGYKSNSRNLYSQYLMRYPRRTDNAFVKERLNIVKIYSCDIMKLMKSKVPEDDCQVIRNTPKAILSAPSKEVPTKTIGKPSVLKTSANINETPAKPRSSDDDDCQVIEDPPVDIFAK